MISPQGVRDAREAPAGTALTVLLSRGRLAAVVERADTDDE